MQKYLKMYYRQKCKTPQKKKKNTGKKCHYIDRYKNRTEKRNPSTIREKLLSRTLRTTVFNSSKVLIQKM